MGVALVKSGTCIVHSLAFPMFYVPDYQKMTDKQGTSAGSQLLSKIGRT